MTDVSFRSDQMKANLAGDPTQTDPIRVDGRFAGYLSYTPLTGRWIFRACQDGSAERFCWYPAAGPLARFAELECQRRDILTAFLEAGGQLEGWQATRESLHLVETSTLLIHQ